MQLDSRSRPFGLDLRDSAAAFDGHLERRLSALANHFYDREAYERLLPANPLVYEVYEVHLPAVAGQLLHGLSIVHPGRVGDEYFMTKGHFHAVRETAEIYCGLRGTGLLLMETAEGDWAVEPLAPGRAVYVPPCWAHRSINTGDFEDLVTFFVYPGHAGHDYAAIEQRGFRKLVVARGGRAEIVDNPRWTEVRER
jgi:glucose-6-phosphate isomerase